MNKSEIEFANEQSNKMSDLISREALIEKLKKSIKWCEDNLGSSTASFQSGCIAAIKDVISTVKMEETCPSVDAVEVVRCKDCKWADPCICVVCEEGKTVVCGRLHMHVNKDDFCSYGERKENGNVRTTD